MSLLLAAGIGVGAGLIQSGVGAFNMWRGKRDYADIMKKYPTFKYEMPSEYGQAVDVAGQAYAAGSPTTQIMADRLSSVTGRSLRNAERFSGSGQELIGSLQESYARELEGLNTLALNDLQYRENARGEYVQSLFTKGQAEERGKQMEYESQFNKWQIEANRAASRSDFGRQMMWQGLGSVAGAATSYLSSAAQMSELQKMFPAGEAVTSTSTLGSGYNMYNPSTWGGSTPNFKFSGAITKPLGF